MTRIAALQTSSSDDVDSNLARIAGLLPEARDQGCEVVALPECFAFMQRSREQLLETSEHYGSGVIQDWLAEQSARHGMYIIAGSVPLRSADPQRITNTLLVYNNHGICIKRYDKIFLFDVSLPEGESYRESSYTVAGNALGVVETPAGRIGLSVCYDLRFPEMYRELVARGARVLAVPAAFSASTGRDHWHPLLRARAIENTCYVVAPAQFGTHNQARRTWGHTLVLDPWGKVLAERRSGWGIIHAEIVEERLDEVRSRLPSLDHLRPDLF